LNNRVNRVFRPAHRPATEYERRSPAEQEVAGIAIAKLFPWSEFPWFIAECQDHLVLRSTLTRVLRLNCAVILGKLAQIDERLFAHAISLFCYKGIATGGGLIDLIAGTSVLK
jgi:hypothetical protein